MLCCCEYRSKAYFYTSFYPIITVNQGVTVKLKGDELLPQTLPCTKPQPIRPVPGERWWGALQWCLHLWGKGILRRRKPLPTNKMQGHRTAKTTWLHLYECKFLFSPSSDDILWFPMHFNSWHSLHVHFRRTQQVTPWYLINLEASQYTFCWYMIVPVSIYRKYVLISNSL